MTQPAVTTYATADVRGVSGVLVSTRWLAERIGTPHLAVVEITNNSGDHGAPGIIPGSCAVYWKDLLWHRSNREFVAAQELSDKLRALGAGAGDTVVFAGEPTQFAAYALWVARIIGVADDTFRYLDGGIGAWLADFGEVTQQRKLAARAASGRSNETVGAPFHVGLPRREHLIGRGGVLRALGTSTVVVDLRSPSEYTGQRVAPTTEPIDHGAERRGRIPGARALHVRELLDDQGRVRDDAWLRARVAGLAADDAPELVFYCRLAHRAALGWLVFTEILDDPRVRVYDGSWTEWGSVVGTPIER